MAEQQTGDLHPTVLLHLLGLVDLHKWGARARIVQVVGAQEGGDFLSAENVADLVPGVALSWVRRVIPQLVNDRVIVRSARAGSAPGWCRVNPDPLEWRRVPWLVDRGDLARRFAFHVEQQRATTTPDERVVARSLGARQRDFFARSLTARQIIAEHRLSRAAGARDNHRSADRLSRALERAMPAPLSRAAGARDNGPDSPRRSSPPHGSACSPPPPGLDPGPEGPGGGADLVVFEQLRRLVLARSMAAGDGRKFLNGRPLDRLRELVAIYGPDVVREAADRVPKGQHRVPGFLEELGHLAGVVAQGVLPDAAFVTEDEAPEGMDLVALHDRADNLRRLILTCEQLGDQETAELRRSELLECENAIEAINGRIPA